MGVWIAILIALFVLGSVMALKPSSIDMRLDKLRMCARRLDLHPKVVTCPDWIRGRDNEFGRGMIGQYTLIVDAIKLPESYYIVIDNELRPDRTDRTDKSNHLTQKHSSPFNTSMSTMPNKAEINHTLDKTPLNLPATIAPLIKGVYSKANSLVVFLDDSDYVKPSHNPDYAPAHIEHDLLKLKASMQQWAQKLATKV